MRRKKFGAQPTNVAVKTEKKKLFGEINKEKLEIEKIEKDLESKKTTLKNKSQELIDLDKKLDKIRLDVLAENDKLVDIKGKIVDAQTALDKVKLEIVDVKKIRDELVEAEKKTEVLRAERDKILKEKDELKEEIAGLERVKMGLLADIEKDTENVNVHAKNAMDLDDAIVLRKKQLLDLDNEIEQKKKTEAGEYGTRIENWKRKEEEVKANIDSLNGEIVKKNSELKVLDETIQKRLTPVNKKEVELKAREESLAQKELTFGERENQVNTLAKTLQKHFDKLKMPIKVI